MKKRNISALKITLIILLIVSLFAIWEYYARETWQKHIISDHPQYFVLYEGPEFKSYRVLDKEETSKLPERYKGALEIVFEDRSFKLRSHNDMPLSKTSYGINPLNHGIISERLDRDRSIIVFDSFDESIEIKIAKDQYIHYDCHPLHKSGNAAVSYKLDDGNKLTAYSNVNVYENFFQHIICK